MDNTAEVKSEFTDEYVEKEFRQGRCYLCEGTEWLQGPYEDVECATCGVDLCVNPLSVTRVGWNMSNRFDPDTNELRKK